MKKLFFLFLVVVFSFSAKAQIEHCDGSRYIDNVFFDVIATKDLKYGEGETISGNFQELYLDIYEPANDELAQRPVILLAFGGSFITGERGDLELLCEAYARKGYVAVTIDYRLYDGPLFPIPTGDMMKEVVIKSVSDMKAAIRYMRQDADTENIFRIDPEMVFVGGISAGAIAAFHTAVIDETDDLPTTILNILAENGGIDGNSSDNYEYSSEVQGMVNYSGGLNDASWIDENDPPFVSIHDEFDPIAPYGEGFATVLNIPIVYLEGSKTCMEVADSVGLKNELKTIEGSDGHVSYFLNMNEIQETIDFTANFLAGLVCSGISANTENLAIAADPIKVFPNPTSGLISFSNLPNTELYIDLFDITGRKLNSYRNSGTLDLNQFANGIYFLNITDSKGAWQQKAKIVLER